MKFFFFRLVPTAWWVVLPSLAIFPWLFLLGPTARELGFVSDVHIHAVSAITTDIRVSELAARITAISSTVLLVILTIPAGLLALLSIVKSGKTPTERVPWIGDWPAEFWIWLLLFCFVVGWAWWVSPQVFELFGSTFNERTLARVDPDFSWLLKLQYKISTFAAPFAGTALAAAATCIYRQANALRDPVYPAKAIEPLARRLDLVLFATAATLVAGMIAVDTWSMWASPMVAGKDAAMIDREALELARREVQSKSINVVAADIPAKIDALKPEKIVDVKNNYAAFMEMKNGIIAIQSVCYVGGLVLTFLPAAVALNASRRRLGVPVSTSAFGFDQIFRLLVLLSPILAGPIVKFLSVKFGGG
jgi:hypothetical protein